MGKKTKQTPKPKVTAAEITIGIVPIDEVDKKHVALVERNLRRLGFQTVRLERQKRAPWIKVKRGHVCGNELCGWLSHFRSPHQFGNIVGVTNHPLFYHDGTGLHGFQSSDRCLISVDKLKTRAGIRGLLIHEVAHLFNLDHCDDLTCLMNGHTDPDEVQDRFCSVCEALFSEATGWRPWYRILTLTLSPTYRWIYQLVLAFLSLLAIAWSFTADDLWTRRTLLTLGTLGWASVLWSALPPNKLSRQL
ncbi:hypothetical protein EXS71_03630 [Candidatus Uhrbacteria bacterium]|nr:hypothetical protein [Candidatus Uhrbacteria bacterium]